MIDPFELDSIADIVRTEQFEVLIAQIVRLAEHHEARVLLAAAREDLPEVRLASGRANGIRLVLSHLNNARERARNGQK